MEDRQSTCARHRSRALYVQTHRLQDATRDPAARRSSSEFRETVFRLRPTVAATRARSTDAPLAAKASRSHPRSAQQADRLDLSCGKAQSSPARCRTQNERQTAPHAARADYPRQTYLLKLRAGRAALYHDDLQMDRSARR